MKDDERRWTVKAAYVLGGWVRDVSGDAELARAVRGGVAASPLGEVTVREYPWVEYERTVTNLSERLRDKGNHIVNDNVAELLFEAADALDEGNQQRSELRGDPGAPRTVNAPTRE